MRVVSKRHQLLFASLMLSLSAGGVRAAQTGSLVEGNTAFALDLYGRLKDQPGNLFFSPYSISTCLAMTYAGARRNTEQQMAEVLHFSRKQDQVHPAFRELRSRLHQAATRTGIELNIANALWAQKGHPFLPGFLGVATDQYEAQIKQADFKTEADSVAREMNQWVAAKTKDKIQNILRPESLDDLTTLVLANAIYFKGTWLKTFDKKATYPQPFHLSRDREVNAPLMSRTDKVQYFDDDALQAVELPYASKELAMLILLPSEIEGCRQLENSINSRSLSGWLARMKTKEVDLLIPKFKAESSFNLGPTLAAMGMRDAFTSDADFSGMDGSRDLFVSLVAHKAWVEVSEEGTEAAAATAVVMTRGIHEAPPRLTFRADHPFIFLIRHVPSGSILFLGRLADPKQ